MNKETEIYELITKICKKTTGITDEQIKKAREKYKDDPRTLSEIEEELEKISLKIARQQIEKIAPQEIYQREKKKELYNKYKQNKYKYHNRNFEILEIYNTDNIQSYNETKKVRMKDENDNVLYGFYKKESSPNEYELLISRIGKLFDIPVAEFSMYLENGKLEGISVSCIPDEEKYEFISGYDFISYNEELLKQIEDIQQGNSKISTIDRKEIKKYIELFFEGVSKKVGSKEQMEDIKKDYLSMILFNVMVDQKDFNFSNFALLRNKEDNSYSMAPLFDNGAVKRDERRQGKMILGIGQANKNEILDVLYSDYYRYIEGISSKILNETNKLNEGKTNLISNMAEMINNTLYDKEIEKYKHEVIENIGIICEKEYYAKQDIKSEKNNFKKDFCSSSENALNILINNQESSIQQSRTNNSQQKNRY